MQGLISPAALRASSHAWDHALLGLAPETSRSMYTPRLILSVSVGNARLAILVARVIVIPWFTRVERRVTRSVSFSSYSSEVSMMSNLSASSSSSSVLSMSVSVSMSSLSWLAKSGASKYSVLSLS